MTRSFSIYSTCIDGRPVCANNPELLVTVHMGYEAEYTNITRVTKVTPMELIHVKVEKRVNDKLVHLVKSKVYKNKSEAVREMLEDHMKEHPELFLGDEFKELLKHADIMSDEEFRKRMAEGLKGSKSAAELVSEGRGA